MLHPLLQTIRGMCTDERPYPEIDARLAVAVDHAKVLEDALERISAANSGAWGWIAEDALRQVGR